MHGCQIPDPHPHLSSSHTQDPAGYTWTCAIPYGHERVENDQNEDIHDSVPYLSDNSEDEEALDQSIDNDLHRGSDFGSESSDSSSDDDFEDYNTLDYQK